MTQSVVAACRVASDVVAVMLSLAVAGVLARTLAPAHGPASAVAGWPLPTAVSAAEFALLAAGLIASLALHGHYQQRVPFWSELRRVLIGSALALLCNSFLEFTFKTEASRVLVVATWALFPLIAMLMRQITRHALDSAGVWRIPALVVGDGSEARQAIQALMSEPALGYEIIGQISPLALSGGPTPFMWRRMMRHHGAHLVVLAPGIDDRPEGGVIAALVRESVPFAIMPPTEGLPVADCTRTYFFNHDTVMLSYRNNLLQPVARAAKIAFDLLAAVALLLFLSPVLLAIAAMVKLDGGPILYAHERIGVAGRRFPCLKFRSMVTNADVLLNELLADPAEAAEWAATQKLRRDPRITRVGRMLRRTSLDELPQLLNVLRLEMSLVGPRPIVDKEIVHYGDDIAYYLEARPGLTGLWQVSGRSDTTYAQRVRLDTWYVKNWTLWHDVAILAKTVPAVLKRRGAI